MSQIIRIQIELPVDVVNKVHSYLHSMLSSKSSPITYIPASEWRLPLATIRDFSDEAELAIRDYARAACRAMHPIGLSFTTVAFDGSGNISLPIKGSVPDIKDCISRIQEKFKTRTAFNISVNPNLSLIVGHADERKEGSMNFRRPISWIADGICLTRPGANGVEHRLFVLFFDGGQDAAMHG